MIVRIGFVTSVTTLVWRTWRSVQLQRGWGVHPNVLLSDDGSRESPPHRWDTIFMITHGARRAGVRPVRPHRPQFFRGPKFSIWHLSALSRHPMSSSELAGASSGCCPGSPAAEEGTLPLPSLQRGWAGSSAMDVWLKAFCFRSRRGMAKSGKKMASSLGLIV
jgi:hypothetical protein